MFKFLLLIFVGYVSGDTCPEITTVDNFDFASYAQGIWYEFARYAHGNNSYNCGVAKYTLNNDISNVTYTYIQNNNKHSMESTVRHAPDARKSGKLVYTVSIGDKVVNIIDNILAIDYDNYVFSYTCKYNEVTKTLRENAWITTRSKNPSDKVKDEIEKILKNSSVLDSNRFEYPQIKEEDCKDDA